jgi:hypothetical protein
MGLTMNGKPVETANVPAVRSADDDLQAMASELALERERRRLERQESRARGKRKHTPIPSVEAALYANVGRYAGSVVLSVFEEIGGTDAMADWAEENPGEFYTKMFTKVITAPKQIEVGGSITLEEAVKALDMEEGIDYTCVEDRREPENDFRPEDF